MSNIVKEKQIEHHHEINHDVNPQTYKMVEVEKLLLSIAKKFINISSSEIDYQIQICLKIIVQYVNVERAYIYLFKNNNTQLEIIYHYNQPDTVKKIERHEQVDSNDFSWLVDSILNKEIINISAASILPAKAVTIKYIMEAEKTKSMLIAPVLDEKSAIGFIGIDSIFKERSWSSEEEYLLKNCAEIFFAAIDKKKSVDLGKRTEEKLRTFFERTIDGIFVSKPDGKFIELNPAGIRMLGYSSLQEVLAIDVKKDLYDDYKEFKKYHRLLKEKNQVKEFEMVLKRKDGKRIKAIVTANTIKDAMGKIIEHEGIIRDVTEEKRLEEQLFHSQKLESIGLFVGGIAHDFNNILTTINGNAEFVLMKMDPEDRFHKDMVRILKGGKRAEKLIRQLMGFSRKQMIDLQVVDLNMIITDLSSLLKSLIKEDILFEIKLKKNLKFIKADTSQIHQILLNLIINASYAVTEKKDKSVPKIITIETDEIQIAAESKIKGQHPSNLKGHYNVISVIDTGIGMDKETQNKVFDPFFTTKKDGKGTGLGLSTVFGIVQQNNGLIHIDSEPGEGTVFKVYWPVTDEKRKIIKEHHSKALFDKHDETILVVEDDTDVRELAYSILKSCGYTVYQAENGKIALDLVIENQIENKIDLIISDMIMPEMGGEELAEKFIQINPKIKILLCSGYTESQLFKDGNPDKDRYFFLTKPYTLLKLQKKIRQILDK